jgi:hypothetical protein
MIDQEQLMEIFQYLSSEQGVVKLYNTYRGLPLDGDTVVYKVDEGQITTGVFGYQAVSMALDGKTHMQIPRLPNPLRATVVEVDIKKKRAVLSDFTSIEGSLGHRTTVRVEPSETLEVTIYDGRQRLGGKVVDISTEGMCIYTFFAQMYGLKFEHDKEVFIDFKPPFSNTMIRSKGVITRMTSQQASGFHRLGLKIYPSSEVKPMLDEYILRRQKELMNEMEQRYLSLSRRKTIRA